MISDLAHSGDFISLVCKKNVIIVEKKQTKQLGIRLQEQANKQKLFKKMLFDHKSLRHLIEIPEIVYEKKTDEHFTFGMKYYAGYNIIDVFETRDIGYTFEIIEILFHFLDWEFSNSSKCNDWHINPVKKIRQLNKDISSAIIDKSVFDKLIALINIYKGQKLNVGICHGDLTFSNMIFSNKVIMIDFLPVFHETPIQDLVKLMQEVRLEWSFIMLDKVRDPIKVKIAYKFLRNRVTLLVKDICEKYKVDYVIVLIYYIIAIIRIIPYASQKEVISKIQDEITLTICEIEMERKNAS